MEQFDQSLCGNVDFQIDGFVSGVTVSKLYIMIS